MNRSKTAASLIAGVLLGAPVLAAAITNYPVDDFEVLDFDVAQIGPGGSVDEQFVAPPQAGHVIGASRRVQCQIAAGGGLEEMTWAVLDTGSAVNDAVTAGVSAHGNVGLIYDLGFSADITVGGGVDRIELDISGSPGTTVEVTMRDEDLNLAASGTYFPSSTPVSIPLTNFVGVDLENIINISVWLFNEGGYTLREIRLRGEGSRGVGFLILNEAAFVPPLPSTPLLFSLWDPIADLPIYDLDLRITEADAGFTPELGLIWGQAAAFDGSVGTARLEWFDDAPFDFTQIAFTFEFSAPAGGPYPMLSPPDPVHGPEGITLVFPVMLFDSPGGDLVGTSETWLTIDPGADQAEGAFEFENVMVIPSSPAAGGGSVGFTLSCLLSPGAAGVETIFTILEMNWWSEWTAYVPPVGVPIAEATGATSLELTTAPSVTHAGTTIRVSRPFERASRILVYDVSGRRLSSIPIATGARDARWDGRDASGHEAPAGVYFLNVAGEPGIGTRVVKIR